MKIYSDIKENAINPDLYPVPEDLWVTDHGYLNDESFDILAKRRLTEKFQKQSYVRELDNGETWQFNPDGTKLMVRDKDGKRVA